jgi:hypothetical protein
VLLAVAFFFFFGLCLAQKMLSMLGILLFVGILMLFFDMFASSCFGGKVRQRQIVEYKQPKKVYFQSFVQVANAGGSKSDRFNPDLRECVQRNARLAAAVGGAKKLAEISLHEAAND